nr:MAG TPA: hypothetical protein [Caudoviricetes sp.]
MDTIIQLLRRYAPVITAAALMLLVVVAGLFAYKIAYTKKLQEPVILNQAIVKNPQKLAETMKITPKEATEVIAYKENAQPVATYYTQAPTLHDAAVVTKNAIKDKSPNIPPEAIEKSDRTAVVENTDENKVDVYKINLNKVHRIMGGVTVMETGKVYETIGYQAGDFQSLAHFEGKHFKGASALYTFAKW